MNIRGLLRQPVMTVAIHDHDVRWTVGGGGRIASCGRVPLPPGMVDDGVVTDCEAVARVLRDAADFPRGARMQVVAGLPANRTVFRQIDVPALKGKQFDELVGREIRREMPAVAEHAHIAWTASPEREGVRSVFVVGVARDVLESHVYALRSASLHPLSADMRVIAAARAIGAADSVLAYVEDDELEIGIFRAGVPEIVRYVALGAPCGEPAWAEQIGQELARTLKFSRDSHRGIDVTEGLAVSLVGGAARTAAREEAIAAAAERALVTPALRLEVTPGEHAARFAANIGLALKDLAA
jgi:type IV pilus assembly protein PilM